MSAGLRAFDLKPWAQATVTAARGSHNKRCPAYMSKRGLCHGICTHTSCD